MTGKANQITEKASEIMEKVSMKEISQIITVRIMLQIYHMKLLTDNINHRLLKNITKHITEKVPMGNINRL
jgi:hypothetical protein